MHETSKTFETAREAAAFVAGFRLKADTFHDSDCRIDPEEPEAVLIDMDEDDLSAWMLICDDFRKATAGSD